MMPEAGIRRADTSGLFSEQGFEIVPHVLSEAQCEDLARVLSDIYESQRASAGSRIGGVRNLLLSMPKVSDLALSGAVKGVLEGRLGRNIFPVQATFFDKTPDVNWPVSWHQDLTIAVVKKIETAGFAAWSVKEEIVHVQPPPEILERMAVIRLHLDDCDADNGALKIIPRSHLHGKLSAEDVEDGTGGHAGFTCEVSRGGALLMHPLLLHCSSPAKQPSHRRVLHIEYASDDLPNGLRWFHR
jgi:ectoine hydroxylase-related dioxygenase (phytanoyl-CoA dioxygenase family)